METSLLKKSALFLSCLMALGHLKACLPVCAGICMTICRRKALFILSTWPETHMIFTIKEHIKTLPFLDKNKAVHKYHICQISVERAIKHETN